MTRERQFADTNLFLRYLANDIPAQADAVEVHAGCVHHDDDDGEH